MVKIIVTNLFVLLAVAFVYAQQEEVPMIQMQTGKGTVYNSEQSFEFRLATNGFGLGFNYGSIKTFYKSRLTYFSLSNVRSFKEVRQDKKIINVPSAPYQYGKINYLYNLEAGKCIKYFWSDKAPGKGVLVGYVLGAGVTLGILQPVFLKVKYTNPDDNELHYKDIKYTEETKETFLADDDIIGRSRLFKGLFQSILVPGLHGKAAIHCDFGKSDKFIAALEVGTKINLYTQAIQLVAFAPKKPYLIDLYLSLQFGKRS